MIKEWILEYKPKTSTQYHQALREIMQQVALAGLYRGGFFEKAAFYGGTALRIFYGLNRFSEDLDFSLLQKQEGFSLLDYVKEIENEFLAVGIVVSIQSKQKAVSSPIESAFLKSETLWSELVVQSVLPELGLSESPKLKIKIEVDTRPPLGFETEEKLLLKPFSFYVKCFVQEDLFAGKMHALLYRKWVHNVKGRDWYDMEWYIRKGVELNLSHFVLLAKDSGDWNKDSISPEEFKILLKERIRSVNLETAKRDAIRFISNPAELSVWSRQYFLDLVELLKFK